MDSTVLADMLRFSVCHGSSPARHSAPHSCCFAFPSGAGERTRKVKVRNLVGWEKESFTSRARVMHTRKAKQCFHSPLPWASRCSVIPGQQGSIIRNSEKQKPSVWTSPFHLLPSGIGAEHDTICYGMVKHSAHITLTVAYFHGCFHSTQSMVLGKNLIFHG